jgi:hypothetical protein
MIMTRFFIGTKAVAATLNLEGIWAVQDDDPVVREILEGILNGRFGDSWEPPYDRTQLSPYDPRHPLHIRAEAATQQFRGEIVKMDLPKSEPGAIY